MKKIAFYGKGGIGKSTTASNVSAALSLMGKKVCQIGCDPKNDSTRLLLGHICKETILDKVRACEIEDIKEEDIVHAGFNGITCVETGGPEPGVGCAGRGIIVSLQLLDKLNVLPSVDLTLYDVLGDVVCGGFAMPIREGYASDIYIVSSGELMSLYAANNISSAVRNFEDRSYARIFGIVLNHRNVENETEKVQAFAEKSHIPIVGEIPRSDEIIRYEDQGKTVIEGDRDSEISQRFFDLANLLLEDEAKKAQDGE